MLTKTQIIKSLNVSVSHYFTQYVATLEQFYNDFRLILWEKMTNNAGKNTTLEHSSSAGDSSLTSDDAKVVRRTIYTRRDGNTLREEPSKIEEYEPQRGRQNKNKVNTVTISVIKASSVSQVLLNTGIT